MALHFLNCSTSADMTGAEFLNEQWGLQLPPEYAQLYYNYEFLGKGDGTRYWIMDYTDEDRSTLLGSNDFSQTTKEEVKTVFRSLFTHYENLEIPAEYVPYAQDGDYYSCSILLDNGNQLHMFFCKNSNIDKNTTRNILFVLEILF